MCGIFFHSSSEPLLISAGYLGKVRDALSSRGRDSFQYKISNNVLICHSLLSISSIERCHHQPIVDLNTYIFAYNGEVYNWQSLRDRLNTSKSDLSETEVVYEYIVKYGAASFLDSAEGMYAIVFYNIIDRTLFLIRDAYGQKPLYYCLNSFGITISSMKSLFYINDTIKPTESHLLRSTKSILTSITPESKEIISVPRNSMVKINLSNYSFTTIRRNSTSQCDYASIFSLPPSESYHTVAYSAGVDSHYIASVAKSNSESVRLVSLCPPNCTSLISHVSKSAQTLGLDVEIFSPSLDNLIAQYAKFLLQPHDPVYDPGSVYSLALFSYISKSSRVVFGGDGGDELFWGYKRMCLLKSVGFEYIFRLSKTLATALYSYALQRKFELSKPLIGTDSPLHLCQLYEIELFLQQVLQKNDILSLYCSIEYRSPLLSSSIAETLAVNYLNSVNSDHKDPINVLDDQQIKSGFFYGSLNLVVAELLHLLPLTNVQAQLLQHLNRKDPSHAFRYLTALMWLQNIR